METDLAIVRKGTESKIVEARRKHKLIQVERHDISDNSCSQREGLVIAVSSLIAVAPLR